MNNDIILYDISSNTFFFIVLQLLYYHYYVVHTIFIFRNQYDIILSF